MKILVICTGNSARSQMAEGFFRVLGKGKVEVKSAGTHPTTVNPFAIRAMAEAGIDISHHRSKSIREFYGEPFDFVITVCDKAKEECPFFPGAGQTIHHSFLDPAEATGTDEDILAVFRAVRDEIRNWVQNFLDEQISLPPQKNTSIKLN
ncbi:MAG: arsenate reductase ArsC [Calditrichaeota bacterium]|nr:arsenate reductase ArsC [Calditrichota bacterium]